MKIAVTARMRNGYLWEAAQKLGGVKALADHLGVSYGILLSWINFKLYPGYKNKTQGKLNFEDIEKKLLDLTGHLLEDIFPEELLESAFSERPKKIVSVAEVPLSSLLGSTNEHLMLNPCEEVDRSIDNASLKAKIPDLLLCLTPREASIMRMHFGLDGEEMTLEQIGEHFGISRSRVREIEARALNKLRHPARSRLLKPYKEAIEA